MRHGESAPARVDEPFELADGHGDPPLHPDGIRQAELLVAALAAEAVAAVYITTLRRTRQTAEPFLAHSGLVAQVEPDLREVFLGEWEGGEFRRRAATADPQFTRMMEAQRWDLIPGAEPGDVFDARVRAALGRIVARHPDHTVAVVTHGGVIGQLLAHAVQAGSGFAFIGADNASISEIVVHGDRWILRRFNDTSHLRS